METNPNIFRIAGVEHIQNNLEFTRVIYDNCNGRTLVRDYRRSNQQIPKEINLDNE